MPKNLLIIVAFLSIVALSNRTSFAQGQIVFDSVPTSNMGGSSGSSENGSEILLSGTNRQIDLVQLVLMGVSTPRNVRLSIYENDLVNGTPGALIAQSAFQPAPLGGSPNPIGGSTALDNAFLVDFDFDSVLVPDSITVSFVSDAPSGVPGTGTLVGTPSVGGHVLNWRRPVGGDWVSSTFFDNASIGLRITAIPEPSVVMFPIAGCFGLLLKRRRNSALPV